MTIQYQGVWSLASAAQLQSTQRWVTDPLYKNTTLLLQADDAANAAQNNTFLDSSSNNFAITRNGGNPGMTQGTFTPFSLQPGAWGNYFGGSDALTIPSTAALTFGTGDFCVEFWLYRTGSSTCGLFSNSTGSGGGDAQFEIQLQTTTTYVSLLGWNTVFMTGVTPINTNTWYHIAVVRSGTSMAMFVNGKRDATATSANNFSSANGFNIGRQATGTGNLTGYISNLRAVKGSSVYSPASTSITIPLDPLTAITNTSLLTCQSNRFIDNGTANSGSGFAITTVGTPSVQPFSPFAPQFQWTPSVIGGSGYFDGTGDSLAFPTSQASLLPGSGAFTYEVWFYQTVATTNSPLVSYGTGTGNLRFFVATPTAVTLWNGATNLVNQAVTNNLNSWNHFVIQRDGSNVVSIYYNGTRIYTGTVSSNFNAGTLSLGVDGAVYWSGYLSGFKATIGSAVYSGTSITVPTAPPSPTGSTACLNFTNAAIYDGTMKNNLETVGNAQISTAVVKYGSGSLAFDGTGDYLVIPKRPYFDFPGDFTIEFWLYVNSLASYSFLMDTRSSISTFWLIDLTTAGVIGWGPDAAIKISSSAITTGQWYHVAISRLGASTRMFLNGTQTGSTYTSSASITAGTTSLVIAGSAVNLGTSNANVYMDDIRISTGIARYTANFIPPSVALPRQ